MAVQNPKIAGFWIRFQVFGVVEAGNRYKPVQEKPDFMPFWKDEAWEVVLQLIEVVYFNYRVPKSGRGYLLQFLCGDMLRISLF